jgi:hypothetical protein
MNYVSGEKYASSSFGLSAAVSKQQKTSLLPDWIDVDKPGRLRAKNVQAIFNVSRATFYSGLSSGRYPKPDGYDGKMPFWLTSTIRPFV